MAFYDLDAENPFCDFFEAELPLWIFASAAVGRSIQVVFILFNSGYFYNNISSYAQQRLSLLWDGLGIVFKMILSCVSDTKLCF